MQVGPLVTLSKGTQLRALAVAPARRFFPDGFVDFSVDDRAGWAESLMDRLLNTYPYPVDEAKYHRLGWRDNEHIANCNRWAAIDGLMIRHENLSKEMLANLGEILGHSSTTIWAQPIQYGFLERLTDSEGGGNAYVTADRIRRSFNFPVRFLHGADNDVFDPLTSIRSRELLLNVHGENFPADVVMLPGFRHLDPLIGRDAGRLVFPRISEFLTRDATVEKVRRQEACFYFRRPLIGPVIGWLRYDEKLTTWVARVWCRLNDLRSPVSFAAIRVRPEGGGEGTVRISHPVASPGGPTTDPIDTLVVGPMDTLWCIDVELDKGPGAYEISVLSAHEGIEESLSDESRKALRRAELNVPSKPFLLGPRPSGTVFTMNDAEFETWRGFVYSTLGEEAKKDKAEQATVEVPDEPVSESLGFALASCRYPGWLIDRGLADAAFEKLRGMLERPDANLSALFLIGDQIYSDATAGVFDPTSSRERFYDAYREAWTAPNARTVLSRLPVYMMMDDHEAGNDWHPADVVSEKERKQRKEGLAAFRQYQWLHSPGNRPSLDPRPFWYDFELRGFSVFVCDTRSGRNGRKGILDDKQFAALTGWLREKQYGVPNDRAARPKFVVSPSVVVPFLKPLRPDGIAQCPTRSDSWDGFPDQLVDLFAFIAREQISNVVFLCGDSHLSMHTEISFENNEGPLPLRAWCIMASAMYAPYPFVNSSIHDFELDAKLQLPGAGVMHYRVNVKTATGLNGFTRVTARQAPIVGGWEIDSRVVPAHAEVLPLPPEAPV
jgi:cholesterol oxidase